MVSVSSGESMALVGGACEGIATRDQWSKLCKCSLGTIVLCTDSSGICETQGASRRTRRVDTKVYFMQAWAMEPGQRILKVQVTVNKLPTASQKLQLLEQLIAKLLDFDRCSNLSNIDEGVRKIAAHQITASDLNTFTNSFLINMRMKFVTTAT